MGRTLDGAAVSSSFRPVVLIPSYNTGGPRLRATVGAVLAAHAEVWVVIDGSTDGSDAALADFPASHPGFVLQREAPNRGKGAAVLAGSRAALAAGFTHALVMDADGQHPVDHIAPFLAAAGENPAALIAGRPVFGPEVPPERLHGRKLSVGLVRFETRGAIDDPLFGFRVYPLAPLVGELGRLTFARGYDFDPEIAVRLVWTGTPVVNLPAPCRYLAKGEGGVSHFRYGRDNLKMVWLHTRLLAELPWRWRRLTSAARVTRVTSP